MALPQVLVEHCRDPALIIRKQMVTSLTTLVLCYPEHSGVMMRWIKGVLPLILDPEMKVQERVVEVSPNFPVLDNGLIGVDTYQLI